MVDDVAGSHVIRCQLYEWMMLMWYGEHICSIIQLHPCLQAHEDTGAPPPHGRVPAPSQQGGYHPELRRRGVGAQAETVEGNV